jgi:hypothetical protein
LGWGCLCFLFATEPNTNERALPPDAMGQFNTRFDSHHRRDCFADNTLKIRAPYAINES